MFVKHFLGVRDKERRGREREGGRERTHGPKAKRGETWELGHQHGQTLLGEVVLLAALRRPHFLKAGLHFLQDFGGVPHYQLH